VFIDGCKGNQRHYRSQWFSSDPASIRSLSLDDFSKSTFTIDYKAVKGNLRRYKRTTKFIGKTKGYRCFTDKKRTGYNTNPRPTFTFGCDYIP
jgi:hypothetical protein